MQTESRQDYPARIFRNRAAPRQHELHACPERFRRAKGWGEQSKEMWKLLDKMWPGCLASLGSGERKRQGMGSTSSVENLRPSPHRTSNAFRIGVSSIARRPERRISWFVCTIYCILSFVLTKSAQPQKPGYAKSKMRPSREDEPWIITGVSSIGLTPIDAGTDDRINTHRRERVHCHRVGFIQHGKTSLSTECQGEGWLVIIQIQKFSFR